MFAESDFLSVFGPALVGIAVLTFVLNFWLNKGEDKVSRALTLLKINTIAVGALSVVLWFLLPSTATLSSFGLPETAQEIQSNEQILRYLQEYNRAIVRTTSVVYWFLFIFVWWFLSAVYVALTIVGKEHKQKYFQNVRDKFIT
jgi:hypothetical protein